MKKLFGLLMVACISFVGCKSTVEVQADQKMDSVEANADSADAKTDAASNAPAQNLEENLQNYIKTQKESEAKSNLKAISVGAESYFEMEHYSDDGMTAFTRVFPKSKGVQFGPDVNESTINVKYDPEKYNPKFGDSDNVWEHLMFRLSTPAYYTYYYISDGKSVRIKAAASLEKSCDSIFEMDITTVEGGSYVVGPIRDVSDSGDCGPVKLP